MKSILFVQPKDKALEELRSNCKELGIEITNEVEVNAGVGVKLTGVWNSEVISMVLYFNKKSQTSTKLVPEKMPEELSTALRKINTAEVKRSQGLEISTSITVVSRTRQQNIRSAILSSFPDFEDCQKKEYIDYRIKVNSNGDKITITQYENGSLLLQGNYSDLVDRIVHIIEQVKPLSITERALFFVPEESKKEIGAGLNEKIGTKEDEETYSLDKAEEHLQYLYKHDLKEYRSGEILVDLVKEKKTSLPSYNCLVAPFAKVFEGFVIKILLEKGFFSEEDLRKNPMIPQIGNNLKNKRFEPFILDARRNGHVLDDMNATWNGNRIKEMHSDPIAEQGIISISCLEDAIEKIGGIKSCIRAAYKILIKFGKQIEERSLPSRQNASEKSITTTQSINKAKLNGYVGTDESGKGDYFGPLVIAGVYVDPKLESLLQYEGVKDSKLVSDKQIKEHADMIRMFLKPDYYSVVLINPEKYNQLYTKIGNLNTLLAWGHARALENILTKVECNTAIADQFGNESFIQNALLKNGKKVKLIQMPKGEQHIAVAAASILAREAFLNRITSLGRKYEILLNKGASAATINAAKRFVRIHGESELNCIAKLHFKTTKSVLS